MLKQLLLALKRLLRALGPVLVGCIFLGAVYLLYREISKYSLADIRMSLAQISTGSIILSVLLAIINYIILIGYDWLALKGIHKTLPVSRVSLVSFVGQAVSYNFGALLGGSTVRFRFYSSWGFSPMDIVRLVLMLAITFWVGALGLVGAIFMIAPPEIPPELGMHMPLDIRPLGAILFLIAISYLIVCKFIHKPIHIFGKEFAFPPFKIAVAQAVVAGADLVAAGACLYVLLPPDAHVSFLQFLPTYLMAMVAVVLTHVPGGAGVLEVVILHLTTASPQAVFAALLCFRVIYYLLPLLLAAVIFAIYEVRQQAIQESGVLHDAGRWMRAFAPTIMASAVFGIGAILCFYVVLARQPRTARADQGMDPPRHRRVRQHGDRRRRGHAAVPHARHTASAARRLPAGHRHAVHRDYRPPAAFPELVRCPDVAHRPAFGPLHTEEVLPPVLLVEAAPHPQLAVRHRQRAGLFRRARPADLPHGPFRSRPLDLLRLRRRRRTPVPHVRCRSAPSDLHRRRLHAHGPDPQALERRPPFWEKEQAID